MNNNHPFLYKLANFLGDYWTDFLLLICGLVTSAAYFGFTDETLKYFTQIQDTTNPTFLKYKSWTFIALLISIFLTLALSIFHFIKQDRISKLKETNADLKSDRELVLKDLQAVIRGYLWGIVENLEFAPTDRVTIYSHDDKLNHFVPLSRISSNPEFNKHGRNSYPDDEGYIGKTWRDGGFFIDNLPDWYEDKKEYIRVTHKENFPKSLHNNLRMKSRLYFGWRISNSKNEEPLAVLIIESTEPQRWSNEQLKKYFVQEKKKFCNIFERVHKYFPEFSEAREKGF